MTDYNLLINKSNQIHRFVCRIHLFAWFSLLLLFHRFLGLLLDFFLPPFIPAIIILLSLAVAHRGITVISVYRQGRIFFFFFLKRFLSKPYQKEKKKKKTHSSAMSSSSSPGLKDTSGEKKYRFLLHSKAMKRAKYSGMIRSTAWLTTVTIGLVSLLSDFTLLLHPLQVSIVLILVGVAVATGCLYVLHVNTHAQPQRLQYTAPSIRWR